VTVTIAHQIPSSIDRCWALRSTAVKIAPPPTTTTTRIMAA
jgi:hypothetical protein